MTRCGRDPNGIVVVGLCLYLQPPPFKLQARDHPSQLPAGNTRRLMDSDAGSAARGEPRAARSPPKARKPPPKRGKRPPPPKKKRPPPKKQPPKRSPPPPSVERCTVTLGGITTAYTTCHQLENYWGTVTGTAYYSLSGETLSVAYVTAQPVPNGWAGWAYSPYGGMLDSSVVFAQDCGPQCASTYVAKLNGYSPSNFSPSQAVNFTKVETFGLNSAQLAATFEMPWPAGKEGIHVLMASGDMYDGQMMQHEAFPARHTVTKSPLSAQ